MTYVKLLRAHQWYKNILVFLPIVFTRQLFNVEALYLTFLGFLAFCCASSFNYIINDLTDAKKDRLHPVKKHRPIASGDVSEGLALFVALLLLAIALFVGWSLDPYFACAIGALIILTKIYTFWLKNVAFADILMISTNFVVRATAGIFIIHATLSPWLILCPFFLALFMAVAKRDANVRKLKGKAASFRPVLKYYTVEVTNALMLISTTCLMMSYALYAFLNNEKVSLLLTMPFAFFLMFRYLYLVYSGSEIPADPHKAIKDTQLVVGGILWAVATFILMYGPALP